MHHISERKDPHLPLSSLRLLVPPIQLLSAAIWQTIQQKVVADYGLLDDFVTMVTEIVPEVLNHRQRSLLSLGLRVQLILEFCRPEQTIDPKTIQPHLDIIQTLTSLWNRETSDTEDGSTGSNILSLIQTLMKDQDERQRFFQDVFPEKFGPKYNEDIQMLVEKFLSHLEKLLIVPSLQQVACMLSDVPSVLAECVESFFHPQEFKSLLEYQKHLSQPNDNDNPIVGSNICTALCFPPMQTVLTDQEDSILETNVLNDYMDSFGKELTVGTATLTKDIQDSSMESEEGEKRRETESSCVENQSCVNSEEGVKDELSCTIQHVESLHGDNMGLDSCGVEVQVGYNVEIPAEGIGCTENKPCVGEVSSVMVTGEDEHVEPSNRTSANSDYGVDSSTGIEKESVEASNSTLTGEQMKNKGMSNVILSPILYTPAVQVLTLEPVVTASPRPVRQNRGVKMKTFLMIASKHEQAKSGLRGSSTSKTCPTCGKTYTRASDMRRHQRSHTGERPYQCSLCKKLFQFQYDLKRHELNVCRITTPQPGKISSKTPEQKDTQGPDQCEVSEELVAQTLKRTTDLKTHVVAPVPAAYHCSNCDSTVQCPQQFQTHEKARVMNQRHMEAPSGEAVPPATKQNDHQPFSSTVQLEDIGQQNQSILDNDSSPTIHQENTSVEESEVVVRKPNGEPGKEPLECKFCGKTLAFPSILEKQTEIHSEELPHHRTVCNKGCNSNPSLSRHSDKRDGSSAHGDNVEAQETIIKLIQKLPSGRKIKPTSPDELVESTSEDSNQSSHKNAHLSTETHDAKVCHLCDTSVTGAISAEFHSCPNCDLKFKFKRGLKRHLTACKVKQTNGGQSDATNQEGKSVKQDERRKGFKSTKTLGKHKLADNPLYCAECNRSFPDMGRLKTHNLRHKPRPCTMCDESFNGFIDLSQHYADVHNFSGPFPCTFCDRSYTDLRGLIRHERFHTGDLPFKCPKCPKAFSYASALKLHDRTHTKEAPFLCWDCGKGCKSNAALRIHRLCCHSSAEEKRFCCEHCGKAYALKRSLDLHVAKLHTGVRYPCSHCGKLFRSASSLTRHDLTHTQERPYSCNECGKSFRSASELKIHTRYHTGERPFKCQECGKGFVQSYYLTAHMRMHTGEKPYKCPTCDKCFKSAGILKRHQMTHTGEKPHKCSVCEMAFSRPELVKAHIRKSH